MKSSIFFVAILSIGFVLTTGGCKSSDDDNSVGTDNNITKKVAVDLKDKEFELLSSEGGSGNIKITVDLGSTPVNYLLLFTNTSTADHTGTPIQVSSSRMSNSNRQGSQDDSSAHSPEDSDYSISEAESLLDYAREHGIGLRGIPEATEFNANPPPFGEENPLLSQSATDQTPLYSSYTVGDTTHDFYIKDNTTDTVRATVRYSQLIDSIKLNIWVANNAFDASPDTTSDCSKAACMTSTQVSAFAEKFLKTGDNNDIYEWAVNIIGTPWGSHNHSKLIAPTAANEIDILFFDIDNDGSTTGGVAGYFYSKDNYKKSDEPGSNERLIFYLNSVLAATKEGTSWEIGDYWPAEIISTMAHEFQHLIHFYQKRVSFNFTTSSETWLNEMCSQVVEDLLANKMKVNGPRGVDHTDDTAGQPNNSGSSRSHWFAAYPYHRFVKWGVPSVSTSYATSYSFGAYLARNFGGAPFIRDVVQNKHGDYKAVEFALEKHGYQNENFNSVVRKWGIAAALSHKEDMPQGYRYNKGAYFTSEINSIQYELGSINMDNYCYGEGKCGLNTWRPDQLSSLSTQYSTSNTTVLVGENVTGTQTNTVSMKSGVKAAVIKR